MRIDIKEGMMIELQAVIIGVVCGIVAGIPTSALIILMLAAHDSRRARPPRETVYYSDAVQPAQNSIVRRRE